ncbi:MAG: hypothetical protein IJX89_01300 [Alphaproteobacteria bacterium]|nr:hypothetical protein [Alphaproteobacteria bacterium]
MKIKNIAFSGFAAAILAGVSATDASAAINLVTQEYVTAEMGKKQNTLTADNAGEGIKIENGVISAEVDLTNTIGSLTDAEGNTITVEQALAGKQDALTTEETAALETIAGNENLETVLGSGVSSNTVQQVADNATAIEGLESTVGDAESGLVKDVADAAAAAAAAQSAADTAQGAVDALEETVASKADASALDDYALKSYVGTIPETATATDIVGYVQEKTSGIATSENLSELTGRVATAESEIASLQEKAVTTDNMATTLAGYATDTELDAKADASTVTELSDKVTAAQGEIDALETTVSGLKNYDDTEVRGLISDNATNIATNTADIAKINAANYISGDGAAGSYLITKDGNGGVVWSAINVIDENGNVMSLTSQAE